MADAPNPKPLAGIGTALAGGTTVITGVLTFLGVKGGSLDRILVEQRSSSLLFGALIAFGIASGVVVKIIDFPGSVWVLLLAPFIGAVVVFTFWDVNRIRSNLDLEERPFWPTFFGVLGVVLIVIVVAGGYRISTGAALALLGATAFTLGAYGAVGLAIDSKSAGVALTLTNAALVRKDDGLLHLTGSAVAESVKGCERLIVTVDGRTDAPIGRAGADVDRKATVAVDVVVTPAMAGTDGVLDVESSIDTSLCSDRPADDHRSALLTLQMPPEPGGPTLGAKWLDAATLELSVASVDVVTHRRIAVMVTDQTDDGQCDVIFSTALPLPASGDVNVTMPVAVPAASAKLVIGGTFDPAPTPACGDIATMSSTSTIHRAPATPQPGSGITMLPAPQRAYDSRDEGGKLEPGETRTIEVGGTGGAESVPDDALAAIVTLTITETEERGFLSTYSASGTWAGASSINWYATDQTVANTLTVALDDKQQFAVRAGVNPTHFVVDVTGYITEG